MHLDRTFVNHTSHISSNFIYFMQASFKFADRIKSNNIKSNNTAWYIVLGLNKSQWKEVFVGIYTVGGVA